MIAFPFLFALLDAAPISLDLALVKPFGPVTVIREGATAVIRWPDETKRPWEAVFNLESTRPLIASIRVNGKPILENAVPLFNCQTGKRRGGFDEFFDFPPSHPDGTRAFQGKFEPTTARAVTMGDRVEISFDGFHMGIFSGSIRFKFFPGSRLIEQAAVASTNEPDTAYFYDTGLRTAVPRDSRPGNNMDSEISYYDTAGEFRTARPNQSERVPVEVRYRTMAARVQGGSLAVFPSPHKYFMPRDFTTNMGYLWHSAFRGQLSLGIRQLPDDNSRFYPWMNAPPGTEQRMNVFYLVSDGPVRPLLDEVTRYTNKDRFQHLDSYVTVAPHWHFAYTGQAVAKPKSWVPPFIPVLRDMGVDAAIIADFHGDGHPQDLTEVRLQELKAYYDHCRMQSDSRFLLIPSEEANVHYGGHWAVTFPVPVYWFMAPAGAESSSKTMPGYGEVFTIGSPKALLDMVKRKQGFVYQTHPRTKGSKGFPDKIKDSAHFLDGTYFGAGWKQMPADMSSPRLGERSLTLLDDMSNWGLKKKLLSEVDVFQIDATHELYAHMNINYVKADKLPPFDHYGELLHTMERGEFFLSTGEVLMPEHSIHEIKPGVLQVTAKIMNTFPLQFAELVWGDGKKIHRSLLSLEDIHQFQKVEINMTNVEAPGWRWARLAVWDVAGNGAFANPVYSAPSSNR